MNLSPTDLDALAFVSARHPDKDVDVTIILEHGVPSLAISVNAGERAHYIVSEDGGIWMSANGTARTSVVRESPGKLGNPRRSKA